MHHLDRTRPNRAFWTTLLIAFVLLAGWSFASPHMASPDEPAHAAKAAATVRGEFVADESQYNAGRGTFELPALFQRAWEQGCFAFHPDTPAGCSPGITGDLTTIEPVASHVARYNPLYYALIGIPSLFPLSEWTLVAMRLVSALINAVLLALTARVLSQLRRPMLPVLGVLAAATPMAFFIGSSMTPQGPEIFGAMLVAVTLLAMVFEPEDSLLRSRAWTLVVGTAFFALARGLSPVYLLLIIGFVLLAMPKPAVALDIVRDRRFWVPLALCAALGVAGVVYTLLSGSLALGVVYPDPTLTARDVVVQMVRNTDYYLEQILGAFGWGDTHLPMVLLLAIGSVAMLVGVLGMAFARWRGRVALIGIVAVSFVLPILIQLASFHESGMVWQGKYVMPLAILAPLLAGFLASLEPLPARSVGRLVTMAAAVVALCQVAAIAVNIHRYVNGANGPWFELVPDAWTPLAPIWLIGATQIVGWVAVVVLIRRFSRMTETPGTAAPAVTGSSAG